MQIILIYLFLC